MPKRIQRKRTKGWRMPEGAVYVGRGSKFGNPWSLDLHSATTALACYSAHIAAKFAEIRSELRGKDLACWCPLDQPCHADVLLEVANSDE